MHNPREYSRKECLCIGFTQISLGMMSFLCRIYCHPICVRMATENLVGSSKTGSASLMDLMVSDILLFMIIETHKPGRRGRIEAFHEKVGMLEPRLCATLAPGKREFSHIWAQLRRRHSEGELAAMIGTSIVTVSDWGKGKSMPHGALLRITWMLWAIMFNPGLLSNGKSIATWGRMGRVHRYEASCG